MGLLETQEALAKKGMSFAILLAIKACGVDLKLYGKTEDEFSRAYGSKAYKTDKGSFVALRGLLTADEFSSIDALSTNTFEEGYLWVDQVLIDTDIIKSSDEVGIIRQDTLLRRVKIKEQLSVGFTDSVLKKFRVSNIAG